MVKTRDIRGPKKKNQKYKQTKTNKNTKKNNARNTTYEEQIEQYTCTL